MPALPVNVHLTTDHEGPEREQMYSPTLSLTSALYGVDGQGHAAVALPPGKTRHLLNRRLCGSHGRSGWVRKISCPPGFEFFTSYPLNTRLGWPQSQSENFGERKSVSHLSEFQYSGSLRKNKINFFLFHSVPPF
jgi:hypothetical protein